jgi:tetratricopeptide (TPR) repeat protein
MKRVIVTFALALFAGTLASAMAQQPAAANQANVPTNQKVIKDPAEYNAYVGALNTKDPAAKAAAMDAFVAQYPQSIVKVEALQESMAAYQATGNQAKVRELAKKLLAEDAKNVRALAISTFFDRSEAKTPEDFTKVKSEGEQGLDSLNTWGKPEGLSDDEFAKLKMQMKSIFAGAAGFASLQLKDYAGAQKNLSAAIEADPKSLEAYYQIGIAYLKSTPLDKRGFWYVAKAYNLASAAGNAAGSKAINTYGAAEYKRFHGGPDGWEAFRDSVASQAAPPAEIAVTPAPKPEEIACKAVQDNDPAQLSFADWEFVLQFRDSGAACNKEAAEKVWTVILNKQKDSKGEQAKLKIPVKVIAATEETIDAAITEDNQATNKADLHIVMEKPLAKAPAVGSTTDVIGIISEYTPNPFMFTMSHAELPSAKPPVKKPPVKKPVAGAKKKKK